MCVSRDSRSTADRVGLERRGQLRSLHKSRVLEGVDSTAAATRRGPGELEVADGVGIIKDGAVVLDELCQGCRGRGMQLCVQREGCVVQHVGCGGLRAGDVGRGEWSHEEDVCVLSFKVIRRCVCVCVGMRSGLWYMLIV